METLQFKTNIKCSGCVAKVTPGLNKTAGENNWKVDLQTPGKILTVVAEEASQTNIIAAINGAGYQAERLN